MLMLAPVPLVYSYRVMLSRYENTLIRSAPDPVQRGDEAAEQGQADQAQGLLLTCSMSSVGSSITGISPSPASFAAWRLARAR
jgi:hypothetical protein